ncbi:thymidylate synthase [Kitasatospora sp. LaBMicrA B282]|uniref:thymidylate synthase n=1 Tax=Kitasatospora sp. LaBMicrA B282 TaxID=3420949 RepID=UPI003D0B2E78
MSILIAETVGDLFDQAVKLAKSGRRASPRGMPTREVLDVSMRITRPRARLLLAPPVRVLNPAYAVAETVWILSGSDEPWIYDYNGRLVQYADDGVLLGAYGPRLRRWDKVDQLAHVVELLKTDSDSRRAVVQLYDPTRDSADHKDVPCTLGFRFHLREGRLHMSTTMRSQDVWTGMPYDLFSFTAIQELVAGWLEADLGDYHHHIDSLHIYEQNLEQADTDAPAAGYSLPSLAVPWQGFDTLLSSVRAGETTGHPGWDAMGTTMSSYRMWTAGERSRARETALELGGSLGSALMVWYDELTRRRAAAPWPATSAAR